MKLEDAIELVLKTAKKLTEKYDPDLEDEIVEASNIVEDFFVNHVFDGTDEGETEL